MEELGSLAFQAWRLKWRLEVSPEPTCVSYFSVARTIRHDPRQPVETALPGAQCRAGGRHCRRNRQLRDEAGSEAMLEISKPTSTLSSGPWALSKHHHTWGTSSEMPEPLGDILIQTTIPY